MKKWLFLILLLCSSIAFGQSIDESLPSWQNTIVTGFDGEYSFAYVKGVYELNTYKSIFNPQWSKKPIFGVRFKKNSGEILFLILLEGLANGWSTPLRNVTTYETELRFSDVPGTLKLVTFDPFMADSTHNLNMLSDRRWEEYIKTGIPMETDRIIEMLTTLKIQKMLYMKLPLETINRPEKEFIKCVFSLKGSTSAINQALNYVRPK